MTYLVGSRHEGYGETGMAHLLEHMLFLQTKTRKDVKKELTDHGAELNGSTSWDRTNYFETVNATDENLKFALELEADRMVNSKIEKQLLDTEMTVVRNEFEMGENSPDRILMQRALETAYTWHNYGKLPIGNRSDIENVPIDRLAAFYQKYYQPDNAAADHRRQVRRAQDPGPGGEPLRRASPSPPARSRKPIPSSRPRMANAPSPCAASAIPRRSMAIYHVPAGSHPDDAALEVLAGVLGDTPSGRLYKALVDNKKAVGAAMGIAGSARPRLHAWPPPACKMDQSLDEARQILLKTVEGVAAEPPTKEEVERVKTRLLKNIELEMTDSQAVALDLSEYASPGRLAPHVPHARPHQGGHRSRCPARRQGLPEGIQPHARQLHPHQEPRPRRDSGHARYRRDAQGFQGRRGGRRRRSLRSQPGQHRIAASSAAPCPTA